jgi:hypothetical protein
MEALSAGCCETLTCSQGLGQISDILCCADVLRTHHQRARAKAAIPLGSSAGIQAQRPEEEAEWCAVLDSGSN